MQSIPGLIFSARSDRSYQRSLDLQAEIEASAAKQEASLAVVKKECIYLRAHVNLLESRLDVYQKGFSDSVSQAPASGANSYAQQSSTTEVGELKDKGILITPALYGSPREEPQDWGNLYWGEQSSDKQTPRLKALGEDSGKEFGAITEASADLSAASMPQSLSGDATWLASIPSTLQEMKLKDQVNRHELLLEALQNEQQALRVHTEQKIASLDEKLANNNAQLAKVDAEIAQAPGVAAQSTAAMGGTATIATQYRPHSGEFSFETVPPEEYEDAMVVRFEPSVWDATVFVGVDRVGVLGSCFIVAMFFANLFTQMMFIYIVLSAMTDFDFDEDEVKELMKWRLNVGHNLMEVHLRDEQTLVARLCADDGNGPLNVATKQAGQLSTVSEYLPRDHDQFYMQIGPCMSLLALTVWMLTCSTELNRIKKLAWLLTYLPKTDTTFSDVDETLKLKSVSALRAVLFAFVLLVRSGVFLVLLYAGLKYLCMTFTLGDLLLNAAALEIILNVDESVFDGLAPLRLQTFLARVEPFKFHVREFSGLDVHGPLSIVFVSGPLLFSFFWWIQGNMAGLSDARDALCSGELNFAYGYTKGPPWIAWSPTKSPDSLLHEETGKLWADFQAETVHDRILHEVIMRGVTGAIQHGSFEATFASYLPALTFIDGSLTSAMAVSVHEAYKDVNVQCEEIGLSLEDWEIDNIGDVLGDNTIRPVCRNGSKWFDACFQNDLWGQIARTFCPKLCGCDQGNVGQIFVQGCPHHCQSLVTHRQFHRRKCADLNSSRLNSFFPEKAILHNEELTTSHWYEIVDRFEKASQTQVTHVRDLAVRIAYDLRKDGCAAVKSWRLRGHTLCDPDGDFPGALTFRYYCPVACLCDQLQNDCPTQCKYGVDTTPDDVIPYPVCTDTTGSAKSEHYPCTCGIWPLAGTKCQNASLVCVVEEGKQREGRCMFPTCKEQKGELLSNSMYPCLCGETSGQQKMCLAGSTCYGQFAACRPRRCSPSKYRVSSEQCTCGPEGEDPEESLVCNAFQRCNEYNCILPDCYANKTVDYDCECGSETDSTTCVRGQRCNSTTGQCQFQHCERNKTGAYRCICGGALCQENQYCHSTMGCQVPNCTLQDGSARTENHACICGSSPTMTCNAGETCNVTGGQPECKAFEDKLAAQAVKGSYELQFENGYAWFAGDKLNITSGSLSQTNELVHVDHTSELKDYHMNFYPAGSRVKKEIMPTPAPTPVPRPATTFKLSMTVAANQIPSINEIQAGFVNATGVQPENVVIDSVNCMVKVIYSFTISSTLAYWASMIPNKDDRAVACSKWNTTGWHAGQDVVPILAPETAPNGVGWTWQQCAARCAMESECEFWTKNPQNQCNLKKRKGKYWDANCCVEGLKDSNCILTTTTTAAATTTTTVTVAAAKCSGNASDGSKTSGNCHSICAKRVHNMSYSTDWCFTTSYHKPDTAEWCWCVPEATEECTSWCYNPRNAERIWATKCTSSMCKGCNECSTAVAETTMKAVAHAYGVQEHDVTGNGIYVPDTHDYSILVNIQVGSTQAAVQLLKEIANSSAVSQQLALRNVIANVSMDEASNVTMNLVATVLSHSIHYVVPPGPTAFEQFGNILGAMNPPQIEDISNHDPVDGYGGRRLETVGDGGIHGDRLPEPFEDVDGDGGGWPETAGDSSGDGYGDAYGDSSRILGRAT